MRHFRHSVGAGPGARALSNQYFNFTFTDNTAAGTGNLVREVQVTGKGARA
ncbi:MAG: hypothetical protein HYS74_02265 [Parcubacteria group bacterium]|nr:hypothetical protein [Parcubacteria group bacterium]